MSPKNTTLPEDGANENTWPQYAVFVINEIDNLDKTLDHEVNERFQLSTRLDQINANQLKINESLTTKIDDLEKKFNKMELDRIKKPLGIGTIGGGIGTTLVLIVTEIFKFLNSHPDFFNKP